ncbi:hypothetical protein EDB85DRAFT_1383447 [Lactarius pseudohatsudake]|nr:hypothetical protein EDB85DRAFT_1383447 [Lactarius pseudohatsudake]
MPSVAYQGLCFLHEHKIAHCAYGDPNGVMMDIGRSSPAGFDRTAAARALLPRQLFARVGTPARGGPTQRRLLLRRMRLWGYIPDARRRGAEDGEKLRSLVVAMTMGEYGADMLESCLRRFARGSIRRRTTHRFKFPRGINGHLVELIPKYCIFELRMNPLLPHPSASNTYFTRPLGNLCTLPFLYFSLDFSSASFLSGPTVARVVLGSEY